MKRSLAALLLGVVLLVIPLSVLPASATSNMVEICYSSASESHLVDDPNGLVIYIWYANKTVKPEEQIHLLIGECKTVTYNTSLRVRIPQESWRVRSRGGEYSTTCYDKLDSDPGQQSAYIYKTYRYPGCQN